MEDKNVVLIGNGFDLAHELPTKYGQFLDFCKMMLTGDENKNINKIFDKVEFEHKKSGKDVFDGYCEGRRDRFEHHLSENIWYKYFDSLYTEKLSGENWIDFEREISLIISTLDDEKYNLDDDVDEMVKCLRSLTRSSQTNNAKKLFTFGVLVDDAKDKLNFRQLRKKLFDDLQDLIYVLEIYLCDFVEKVKPNLDGLPNSLKCINPDIIISFNYTHTYKTAFPKIEDENIYHIHGECSQWGKPKNNMVVGIDEYLDNGKENIRTDYAIFKKFVQRIQKRNKMFNSNTFYFSVDTQYGESQQPATLHVFGHSLDVTDKDILVELFENNTFNKIIVYCYDKPTEGEYIANIIKIIGQKALIERTKNNEIEFEVMNP